MGDAIQQVVIAFEGLCKEGLKITHFLRYGRLNMLQRDGSTHATNVIRLSARKTRDYPEVFE
jgi:hypothetical protein